ncbi:MAG: GNAT family N-acetyltransferase [Sphaerochaetaceae bacterium]
MAERLEFKNLAELEKIHLRQAVEIFADSFYETFTFISADLDEIVEVLEHSFISSHHYVALLDNNVVGVVAFSTSQGRAHKFKREVLFSKLGFIKGSVAYRRLNNVLGQPLKLKSSQCYIDSVATDTAFRGLGISKELQKYLFATLPYKEYLLEVAKLNFRAIKLYRELGFEKAEIGDIKAVWKPVGEGEKIAMYKAF